MKLGRRFTLAMAVVALVIYSATDAKSDEVVVIQPMPDAISIPAAAEAKPSDFPAIEVVSLQASGAMQPVPAPMVNMADMPMAELVNSAEYRRVYKSIPFSRAEYNANPNYRHDSAMEILTGHARHQTIVQHNFEHKQPIQRPVVPAQPSRILVPFSGLNRFWNIPTWYYRGL